MYTKYKGQLSGDTDYRVTHSETVEVILMTDQRVPLSLGVRLHDVAVVCVDEDHNVLQFTHENVKQSKVVCADEDHSVMQFTTCRYEAFQSRLRRRRSQCPLICGVQMSNLT